MLKKEFGKTGIRFYGIGLIAILVCGISLIRMQDHMVFNAMLEYNKTKYVETGKEYSLEGRYTRQKKRILDGLYENVKERDKERGQAVQDYLDGEIEHSEYNEIMIRTDDVYDMKNVLEQFLTQYEQAEKKPDTRYIMYGNGWIKFFCQPYGYLSLLAAVIIAVFLWMPEFNARNPFYNFMITTSNGYEKIVKEKRIILYTMIAAEELAEQLCYSIYLMSNYGLEHGEWPLQSLPVFYDSVSRLSIWQGAFLRVLICFLIHYVLSLFVSIIILWTKNIQSVLAASGTLVLFGGMLLWSDDILAGLYNGVKPMAVFLAVSVLLAVLGNWLLGRIWLRRQ